MPKRRKPLEKGERKQVPQSQPGSAWQLELFNHKTAKDLSWRDFADAISGHLPAPLDHTTLYFWVTTTTGYASPKRYTPKVNLAVARAIGVPEDHLAQLYDAARQTMNPSRIPAPLPTLNALQALLSWVDEGDSATIRRSKVRSKIQEHLNAEQAEEEPRRGYG